MTKPKKQNNGLFQKNNKTLEEAVKSGYKIILNLQYYKILEKGNSRLLYDIDNKTSYKYYYKNKNNNYGTIDEIKRGW